MKWLLLVTWFWSGAIDSYQVGFGAEAACRDAAKALQSEPDRFQKLQTARSAAAGGASRRPGGADDDHTDDDIPEGPMQVSALCARVQ